MSRLAAVPGREVPPSTLGTLDPVEVLIDIDGPRLFIARSLAGDELLAYHAEETDTELAWIVVPTDASTMAHLRAGDLPLRDALRQPWVWIVTQAVTGEVLRTSRVSFADIPNECLPTIGATLVERPTPLLVVRAVGPMLTDREVPASVVRRVIDGAMHAMKALVEHALDVVPSEGRPTERLRRYYDLPTQRISFGSLEVAFGDPFATGEAPLLPRDQQALDRSSQILRRGIEAIQGAEPMDGAPLNAELGISLDALSGLLPPGSGAIEEVYLGGRLVAGPTQRLTREHASRARRIARRTLPMTEPVQVQGLIRELDKDALTFIVRSVDLTQEWPCRVSPALREDVFTAFTEDTPVAASGHRRAGKPTIEVLVIDLVG
jgi:hypothetical protein